VTGVTAVIAMFGTPVTLGTDCAVTSGGTVTVNVNVLLDVSLAASVTVTLKTVVASATVGVPLIRPVVELIDTPLGSAGEIANAYGVVPPLAVTGVTAVIAVFLIALTLVETWVVANGGVVTAMTFETACGAFAVTKPNSKEPAGPTERPLNVATPLAFVVTVFEPLSVPVPLASDAVTATPDLPTLFPDES
jgi:hypothetical protein